MGDRPNFDHLKWTSLPEEPGWYFAWMGLEGMMCYRVIPQIIKGQRTVLGGKDDGAPLTPVEEFGARLWAGPLPVDPRGVAPEDLIPPILPASEHGLLEELKRRKADGDDRRGT
jgi:hypothetical protein